MNFNMLMVSKEQIIEENISLRLLYKLVFPE